MDIEEILSYCQSVAIRNLFFPDGTSLYRKFCRNYSKLFHTPLPEVEKLDPIHVIQSVTEDRMEVFDLEDDDHVIQLLERIAMIEDPDYQANNEEDLQDFMEAAEEEEELRIQKKVPLSKALKPKKKEAPQAPAQAPEELPKSGGINLSYLNESKNEG